MTAPGPHVFGYGPGRARCASETKRGEETPMDIAVRW
jgi:hypothetical protein